MQTLKQYLVLVIATCPTAMVLADDVTSNYTPDSHAPAGIMADHLHARGEWMFGYMYMQEDSKDMYAGSSRISDMDLAAAGYTMAPTAMSMEMHMLHFMYAPSDNITLMVMPQYMSMEMSMMPLPAMEMGTGSDHGGHAASAMGAHHHTVSGIGDTQLAALLHLATGSGQQLHMGLGVSAPTGSVEEKNVDGTFVHYGMQPGTGTWNFMPSLTYKGAVGRLGWGAQLGYRLPLENENESGYAVGEQYNASIWTNWRLNPWLSSSVRLRYRKEGNINGHYNGAHNHASPPDRQANYGGELLDYAIGFNTVARRGPLAGLRLGLEWSANIDASYNGFQLGRQDGFLFNLSKAY